MGTTTTHAITYTLAPPSLAPLLLLGLDVSSVAIGFCVFECPPASASATRSDDAGQGAIPLSPTSQNGTGCVRDHGEILLKHADINQRCRLARAGIAALLRCWPSLDAAAIESPASTFKKSLIPQCFVSGAVRSELAMVGLAICDVTPSQAKQALTGGGAASKTLMMAVAAERGVSGEHASDALGVVLAAMGRVKKMTAAPATDPETAIAQTLALLHAELARQTRRATEARALLKQCKPWIPFAYRELRDAIEQVLQDERNDHERE